MAGAFSRPQKNSDRFAQIANPTYKNFLMAEI